MSSKPSRFVIPAGTDLTSDPDVFPVIPGQMLIDGKTPQWKTAMYESVSGRETRLPQWSYPRWMFKITHEFVRNKSSAPELARIFAFFNSHRGRHQEFLYRDTEDCTVNGDTFGIGNGSQVLFTLSRTMHDGGISFTEPIMAFYGNPVVRINGVTTTAFTMLNYGDIQMNSAPANGAVLTWSGTFFFVCRFDSDEMTVRQFADKMWSGEGLTFRSIKP